MKNFTFFLLPFLVFLTPCQSQDLPQWELVKDSVAWLPRDSQGELVFKDHLWIFGGWHSSYEAPPRDVWKSKNGKRWKKVTDKAPWIHSDLPMVTTFRGKMWFMGGWYNGRLEGRSASNQVWSSENGENWDLVVESANWDPRCAAAIVEFKGKIWLLGGTNDYYYGDEESLLNDVWYSEDGKDWKLATDNAGWPPRAFHQAVVLNNKIYLMGGGNYDPEYKAYNDVWSSEDGIHWVQETESSPWHERIWFSSVVYRGNMWVLGGWSNNPYINWEDAWYSSDGRNWNKLNTKGPMWKGRHEHSAYVFKNRLWIAGGMTPPLVNDVWSIELLQPSNINIKE
ncbi:Kelch repeat-containing protein [Membranihabitans maritimus]|uniref:Kelch repeat-containing protein n=1 Tax=Membranihabitans maritimus TaxID=2904244 RepID=UPI001F45BEF7|nr:hypothetical protein [Membranihabitans maritimus]